MEENKSTRVLCDTRVLFHLSAWLDHALTKQPAQAAHQVT